MSGLVKMLDSRDVKDIVRGEEISFSNVEKQEQIHDFFLTQKWNWNFIKSYVNYNDKVNVDILHDRFDDIVLSLIQNRRCPVPVSHKPILNVIYQHANIEIRKHCVSGEGVVATKSIKRGEMLVQEKPFCVRSNSEYALGCAIWLGDLIVKDELFY